MQNLKHYVLAIGFLAIISGVPLTQAALDLVDGDKPQFLELFEQAPSEKNLRKFEEDLEANSIFEESIRPVYQGINHALTGELGAKAVAGKLGWYFFRPGMRYLLEPYYKDLKPAKFTGGDPIEAIEDFHRQLTSRGIELLVVPIPGKASIYPEKLTDQTDPEKQVYQHSERFIAELRARGVPAYNMHRRFSEARAAAAADSPTLFMATDTHWSGAGVEVAASALAEHIRAMPWFSEYSHTLTASDTAAHGPVLTRQKITVKRRGDVPVMTQIPRQEALFPEEEVDVYQVHDRDDALYADDRDSPILVLGDSFSRVFHSDAPRSAGFIANLACELQMPLASIVNDGGASTLVRQQLARDPTMLDGKKLVIWEFIERDIRFGMQGWQKIAILEDTADDNADATEDDPGPAR